MKLQDLLSKERDGRDVEEAEYRANLESVKAQVESEPPITVAPLPPYDHGASCPKCHFTAGTTQYRSGYHGDCAIPETPFAPFFSTYGLSWPTRETLLSRERFYRDSAVIPEHFDRECPNCKHRWAEAVA